MEEESILVDSGKKDLNEKVSFLRKEIAVLEWDIPNIRDNGLRSRKESQLKKLKKELEGLLIKACEVSQNG